jgi:tRNA A-37 threonylcarbamoyl transferase component Bud32
MAWFETLPRFASMFPRRSWDSASSFLSWTGILVNKHRDRQVEQVSLSFPRCDKNTSGEQAPESSDRSTGLLQSGGMGATFFLKKEYAVSWGERIRNAWHGFGWCSTAVREAAMLRALREGGIGCPEVVALGEDRSHAFVLTRDESAMTELRAFLPTLNSDAERRRLADALGRELARMHGAGFDHPDLLAKHILVTRAAATFRFCILDWQRGRRRRIWSGNAYQVPWRLRRRDLATLDSTLHDALASNRLRLRFLLAYVRALAVRQDGRLGLVARKIRRQAEQLRLKCNIREASQLPVHAGDQQLVPFYEGRLLVVRSYYEKLGGRLPDWLMRLGEPQVHATNVADVACSRSETLNLQIWPACTPAWEIPPLAHTLFRLQRFAVPAPRLLAVGCSAGRVFLLAESVATDPFVGAFAKASFPLRTRMLRQAGWIVRQIHEAGYHLPPGETWECWLGAVRSTGGLFLTNAEPLVRSEACWQERAPTEFKRHNLGFSLTEQMRFLQSYFKKGRGSDWEPAARRVLFSPDRRAPEGQAIS